MKSEIAVRQDTGIASYSVAQIKEQVSKMQRLLKDVMVRDTHYGVIPGTGEKPSLYKAGAEKISLTFRLAPEYEIFQTDLAGEHREYRITCVIRHITSGEVLGQGVGICSTRETKYRFRQATRKCPKCSKPAIIKGKTEYGGGWVCFKKKDGCGAKFADDDISITAQSGEREENPNIADTYNTVLKISKKRAHVDSILTVTAASDIFTQDVEDMPDVEIVSSPSQSETTLDGDKSGEGESGGGDAAEPVKKRPGRPRKDASREADKGTSGVPIHPDIPESMADALRFREGIASAYEHNMDINDYWRESGEAIDAGADPDNKYWIFQEWNYWKAEVEKTQ